jgi:hypothetical protein
MVGNKLLAWHRRSSTLRAEDQSAPERTVLFVDVGGLPLAQKVSGLFIYVAGK